MLDKATADAHSTDIMHDIWKEVQKEREEEDRKKQARSGGGGPTTQAAKE